MPTFPEYHGPPLPDCLNPLNPRHYLMLLDWIFFKPSRLKHYIHNTAPELCEQHGVRSCVPSLRLHPCRSVLVMSIFLVAILVMLLSATGLIAFSPLTLPRIRFLAITVILGFLCGLAGTILYGAYGALSNAIGLGSCASLLMGSIYFLVAYTSTYSVGALGVILLILAGAKEDTNWVVLIALMMYILWLVLPLGMAINWTSRLESVVPAITALSINVIFIVLLIIIVAISVPSSSPSEANGSETILSVVQVALISIALLAFVFPAPFGWFLSILVQVGFNILFEMPWSMCIASHNSGALFQHRITHPALWDETIIAPAPRLASFLKCSLIADETQGLLQIRRVAANPFQRWAVQRAICDYVATTGDPLGFMYRILRDPRLDEYILEPVTAIQRERFAAARSVILGEWAHTFVGGTQRLSDLPEKIAYALTRFFRCREMTPLSQFAHFCYQLLDKDTVDAEGFDLVQYEPIVSIGIGAITHTAADQFDLLQYEPIYAGIRSYPHGEEIYLSFATLAALLEATDTAGIAASTEHLAWLDTPSEHPLRPEVLEGLRALGDVSAAVAQCQRSTSRVHRSAALNRAAGALNELATYLQEEAYPPEQTLLTRVVRQWQSIVAKAQGHLGEEALREMTPQVRRTAGIVERRATVWRRPTTPLPNPYKAGDPVYPPLFVGRKDVFDRIGQVWSAKENPDSIILYGHRRIGKTSILRNLDQYAPQGSVLVYLDLKGGTSFVQSTADLLLGLADAIHTTVYHVLPDFTVPAPDPADYSDPARARFHLDRFLRQVQDALAGRQLILALDEFEAIEGAVQEGCVGREIYQYLRAKTQEPWLTIVFAGLHTLDEMSREYRQPFYGSYVNICVSYLNPETARRLITNPRPDFLADYDLDVVEQIIKETYGQPMLIQCICQELVNHLNHELFDLNREREVRITQEDLEAVLTDDFIRSETRYFDGVWSQVRDYSVLVAILTTMAQGAEAWKVGELVEAIGLDVNSVQNALEQLRRRDILAPLGDAPDRWHFLIPLMRRWIMLSRK